MNCLLFQQFRFFNCFCRFSFCSCFSNLLLEFFNFLFEFVIFLQKPEYSQVPRFS